MFSSLDGYINLLNNVKTTAEFILGALLELLSHAATIASAEGRKQQGAEVEYQAINAKSWNMSKEWIKSLVRLAHNRKDKWMNSFNSGDGEMFRLAVKGHEPLQANRFI